MSFSTYSDLQTSVANWIARSDLTSVISDFITLFEAELNRRLRVRQMETSTSLTTSAGVVSLPTDYLAWRRLTYANGSVSSDLQFVHPSYLRSAYPTATSDIPRLFTIEGSSITVRPYDDSTTLTFDYYQKLPALSVSNTTNWLLTAHPDLYLSGTLVEAYAYQKDADKVAFWAARREGVISEIEKADAFTRGPSAIKVAGPTP